MGDTYPTFDVSRIGSFHAYCNGYGRLVVARRGQESNLQY